MFQNIGEMILLWWRTLLALVEIPTHHAGKSCINGVAGSPTIFRDIHFHNDRRALHVILQPADYGEWLDEAPRAPDSLQHLIAAFPAELMEAYPVSALVNSPSNDRAELLQPA